MNLISGAEALLILKSGARLEGYEIDKMELTGDIEYRVHLENCKINSLCAAAINFSEQVVLRNCTIADAAFMSAFYTKGLIIDHCVFHDYANFEAGGA
jgi:hypothetical protein